MFERFFNYSNELMCIASLDGYFIQINDAFIDTLGYPKETLLSEPFTTFIHPNDIDKTLDELKNIGNGVDTVNFENRYCDSNGEIKILSWQSTFDHESNSIFATARDITQERLAISQYSQLYKAVSDNIIFAKTNVKGVITEVNQKFCDISGYDKNELVGRTHKIVNSGYHSRAFFSQMWQTISSGTVWTGVITNRAKNGKYYIVKSIIIPLFNIDNQIESYIALRQDITEQIQYQQANQKNLEILHETGTVAKVGGWELNTQSNEIFCTAETSKIFDLKSDGPISISLKQGLSLFSQSHSKLLHQAIDDTIKTGSPFELEIQTSGEKQPAKWLRLTGKKKEPFVDERIIFGTVQDIHEHKLAQIKYKEERRKSIQNAKFSALGELAASIAHEINNPLGIISGFSEILLYQLPNQDEKLSAIIDSCDRISHIVKNLKRFSSTDTIPCKTRVNLSEVVKDAISLTQPRARKYHAKLTAQIADNISVWGVHIELEQVLINLINNAIDAVETSLTKIITVQLLDKAHSPLVIIEDTGGGIDESFQLRIFDPFVTTKSENKGTGLGLSVVKGILEDHNAHIKVNNTECGARFEVSFPPLLYNQEQGYD
ncbi:PAS domain-containing sensor histidine kinase [Pseudoalteromonas spongiae]|uniref:PAS domain-containing sensor histidine kinase n=1 Tax=Pseudoalteromonas spongiae TaxID=298657 RepID=UPI000C2D2654|nr:PAS domain-containing sensor histidine kinase [Pseudoalteromonas spongiae]